MGKLTIRGKASMNCTYDILTLEIEFYKDGNTANTTMDAVLTQCESFLSYLDSQGVPIIRFLWNRTKWNGSMTKIMKNIITRLPEKS